MCAVAVKFFVLFQAKLIFYKLDSRLVSNRFRDCNVLFAISFSLARSLSSPPPLPALTRSLAAQSSYVSRRQHPISVFLFHISYACVCMVIYEFLFRFFLISFVHSSLFSFFFSFFNFSCSGISQTVHLTFTV